MKRTRRVRKGETSDVTWSDYPRLQPGEYPAYSVRAKAYRDPQYKRWTSIVWFDVLAADQQTVLGRVPWWLCLGSRNKPHAGRRSKYFLAWIRAYGGTPLRGDRMSARVFTHRMARVLLRDTTGPAPYSTVAEILSWETGSFSHQVTHQVRPAGEALE
jgi:hypothetical protein